MLLAQFVGQPVMPIEIKLQREGTPGGHPQVAQAKLFIYKVKVIVQTFACIRLEKRFAGLLVLPGLVAGTSFHGRKKYAPIPDARRVPG